MELPVTTTDLLRDLADPGRDDVWAEFDRRYRAVLEGLGRRAGLRDDEAAEAAQETLVRFLELHRAGRYAREKGHLRSWILGIARNVLQEVRRRRPPAGALGGTAVEHLSDATELEACWDEELERLLLARAMERLRTESRADPRTIRMFEHTLDGTLDGEAIAALEGATRNDVYLARHRCLKRLREIVAVLRAAYEAAP